MLHWFCEWRAADARGEAITEADLRGVAAVLAGCGGLASGEVLIPTEAVDPHYAAAEGQPALVVQAAFASVEGLERALHAAGPLSALADPSLFPALCGLRPAQETMIGRRFALPVGDAAPPIDPVVYLVTYEGPAEDEQAWHAAYLARHPTLLSKFPHMTEIEIYTPATIVSGVPIPIVRSLQRNRTVFASIAGMRAAMLSPVRDELRRDFHSLPPFSGASLHFPFRRARRVGAAG